MIDPVVCVPFCDLLQNGLSKYLSNAEVSSFSISRMTRDETLVFECGIQRIEWLGKKYSVICGIGFILNIELNLQHRFFRG